MHYRTLTDRELVTELERHPAFQREGSAERELLLRLAQHAHHPLRESDVGRVRHHVRGDQRRYNGG